MVLGLFSKERALKKNIERAMNKLAQHEDRSLAMEKLAQEGSEEALLALCKRFSFVYDKSIQDQEEKDWVVETLVSKGTRALDPLAKYMRSAPNLGYPLIVLGRIAQGAEALSAIDLILAEEEPGYTRDPKKRIDVIEWLAEWDGADNLAVVTRVTPYLGDFDENVRFKVIEALDQKPDPTAAPHLCKAILNEDEESARIRQRAAEVLAEHSFDLGDAKKDIANMLGDKLTGFKLHRDKLHKK